jgi:transposase
MKTDYYVGLDIHKRTIVAAVVDRRGGLAGATTLKATRADLLEWITAWSKAGEVRIALEASGSSAWVTYALLENDCEVVPVHPRHVRAIAETKQKSDRLDARKLAELLRAGVLRPVNVPSQEERASRALVRQLRRVVSARTRAKNAVTSLLAELGHACPWTDAFGKSGRRWLMSLRLAAEHRLIVEQELAQIDLLRAQATELEGRLEGAVEGNALHALARTAPGVGPQLGAAIALEFGDIRRFKTAKAAASYSGLIPSTYQSGESRRGGRITREGNAVLRWALVQAALQLVRRDAGAKRRYTRLRNRLKKHKARIAMARHLAVVLWHMARTGEAYRREPEPEEPKAVRRRAAPPKRSTRSRAKKTTA